MRYATQLSTPLGPVTLASDGERITGLWFEGQKYFAVGLRDPAWNDALPVFARAAGWLERYFRGEAPAMDLPIAPGGTPFQRAVWARLCAIPYGQITTYGDIARAMGAGARAVGAAVSRNPISLLIPCHRVVGTGGGLTGYAGGLDKKRFLLALEGRNCAIDNAPCV